VAIGGYSIGGYLFVAIHGYSIVAILFVGIHGYFINGYWWLFY